MIYLFQSGWAFLSNFYPSPITKDGVTYQTMEHFFQTHKTNDSQQRLWINDAITPNIAKKRGRATLIRPDWEEIKLLVMEEGLRLKFSNPELMRKLISTTVHGQLVEGNYWHDNFWGDCYCYGCRHIEGQNHLGKLLMKIRDE